MEINRNAGPRIDSAADAALTGKYERVRAFPVKDGQFEIEVVRRFRDRLPLRGGSDVEQRRFV
jgi:hypothetical protein